MQGGGGGVRDGMRTLYHQYHPSQPNRIKITFLVFQRIFQILGQLLLWTNLWTETTELLYKWLCPSACLSAFLRVPIYSFKIYINPTPFPGMLRPPPYSLTPQLSRWSQIWLVPAILLQPRTAAPNTDTEFNNRVCDTLSIFTVKMMCSIGYEEMI